MENSIEARLDRIERENSRLRIGATALIMLAGLLCCFTQERSEGQTKGLPRTFEDLWATQLRVTEDAKLNRLVIQTPFPEEKTAPRTRELLAEKTAWEKERKSSIVIESGDNPRLVLRDKHGKIRMSLGMEGDDPALSLFGTIGQLKLKLGTKDSEIALFGRGVEPEQVLTVSADGMKIDGGSINMMSKGERTEVSITKDFVNLRSHEGKKNMLLSNRPNPTLIMTDFEGTTRLALGLEKHGRPFVSQFDEDGKVIRDR